MTEKKYVATRVAYGEALKRLGGENEKVIALDADVSSATYSKVFGAAYPERFFNMGIAEANMVGVAAGMADAGYIPFVHAFAMFGLGRAYDQVRNTVAYSHANVKFAYSHAGITGGPDGGTHQSVEDLTLARAIPGITILCPCDETATYQAVELASEIDGPVYIRLCRQPSQVFAKRQFSLGASTVMAEGADAVVFTYGLMVGASLEAAQMLASEGIQIAVIDLYSLRPIDTARIRTYAERCGRVISVEENSINGGLGDAVDQVLCEAGSYPHLRIAIQDCFGQSGDPAEILHANGLDAESIHCRIQAFLEQPAHGGHQDE